MKRVFIDSSFMHPLVRASIVRNDVKNLKMLHESKRDLFALDKNGYSALLLAAEYGSIDAFKYLLDLGLDSEYTAPDGKCLSDYLDNPEIKEALSVLSIPQSTDIETDNLLDFDWEPEEEFIPIQQEESDIAEVVEFQEMLSEMEIVDTDTDWDSSWIELPSFVELREEIVSSHAFSDAMKRFFWMKEANYELLENLASESEVMLESLKIALSCSGIELSDEVVMPEYILDTEFDQTEYEDFIHDIDSIVYEETKYHKFQLNNIYGEFANLKKRIFEDASVLFDEIELEKGLILELLLKSKETAILLLALLNYKKNEWNAEEIDLLLGYSPVQDTSETQVSTQDIPDEFLDVASDDIGFDVDDDGDAYFTSVYTIGSTLFENSAYDREQAGRALKELCKSDDVSEMDLNNVKNCITLADPTTYCFERICFELSLRNLAPYTVEQVTERLKSIQDKRYDIALQNYGLLIFVYKKVYASGISPEEIIQEGFFGLVRAAEKFDLKLGNKFSTYAVNWIRQAMVRYRDDHFSVIRYPVHFSTLNFKYRKIKSEYENRDQDLPSLAEFAELMEVSEKTVEGLEEYFYEIVSFDEMIEADNGIHEDDDVAESKENLTTIPPLVVQLDFDKSLIENDLHKQIQSILSEFHPRMQEIVNKRFGLDGNEPMTLEDLGKIYKVTRERIRQIEVKAIKRIRGIPRLFNALKDFIE